MPQDSRKHQDAASPDGASGHVNDVDGTGEEPVSLGDSVTVEEVSGQDRKSTEACTSRIVAGPPGLITGPHQRIFVRLRHSVLAGVDLPEPGTGIGAG